MTEPFKQSNVSRAIGLLTAWLEWGDDPEASDPELFPRLAGEELAEDPSAVVAGLGSVAGVLLLRLSTATKQRPEAILQDIARRYGGP